MGKRGNICNNKDKFLRKKHFHIIKKKGVCVVVKVLTVIGLLQGLAGDDHGKWVLPSPFCTDSLETKDRQCHERSCDK